MTKFTIRIELLGSPSARVYAELNAVMQQNRFNHTINGVDASGKIITAILPHATYYGSADLTANAVRDWVQEIVKEIWSRSIVFVADTTTWARGES